VARVCSPCTHLTRLRAPLTIRIPRPLSATIRILGTTYKQWRKHRTIRLGAGIAYYGLFATVPILALSFALASLFVSESDIENHLASLASEIFGTDADAAVDNITEALSGTGTAASLGIIGLVSLLFTASVLVFALQDALSTIWELPVVSGWRESLARRLLAFGVVLATGAYLIASLAINAVIALFERIMPDAAVLESLTELFGVAASWVLGVLVVALLFRYMTDVRVRWRSALTGGAITAFFMAVGAVAIGAYLQRYAAVSFAGATGGVFLFLIWMYYEGQIMLAGAELTRVLASGGQLTSGSPALAQATTPPSMSSTD
jgi:membrane protein